MSGMGKIHMNFQNVEERFNEKSFSKHKLFNQRHKVVLHILLDICNQFKTSLIKGLKKVLRNVALISKKGSFKMADHFI